MGMHSEKHHLPARVWAPQHGQLVAEELARGGTWLRVGWQHPGQQHPVSPEPPLSSACCPGWVVALFWSGFAGARHPSVSTVAGMVICKPRLRTWHWWKMRATGKVCAGHCWQRWQILTMKVSYGLHEIRATLLNAISSQSTGVSYSWLLQNSGLRESSL